MNSRSFFVASTVITAALAGVLPASGQTDTSPADQGTVPRTPDGQPDLQGVWANNNVTPLERPEEWAGKERLTEQEVANLKTAVAQVTTGGLDAVFGDQLVRAAIAGLKDAESYDTTGNYNQFWLVERDFNNRTSLVIDPPDGRIPALTPAAQQAQRERAAYRKAHPADGPEDRSLGERCVNFGVPKLGAGYNAYRQILQTPGYIAIYHEMAHDVRLIPLDGRPHVGEGIRQWNGDPRGHWESDTLVVETTNFSPKSNFNRGGATENLHLVERFTRVGPYTLNYEATITDPTTWPRPWTVLIPLKKSEDAIYEYACHEGNYGMEGILAGHRAQERAAAVNVTESR